MPITIPDDAEHSDLVLPIPRGSQLELGFVSVRHFFLVYAYQKDLDVQVFPVFRAILLT